MYDPYNNIVHSREICMILTNESGVKRKRMSFTFGRLILSTLNILPKYLIDVQQHNPNILGQDISLKQAFSDKNQTFNDF